MIKPVVFREESNFHGYDKIIFKKITDENYELEYEKDGKKEDIILDAYAKVLHFDKRRCVSLNPERYIMNVVAFDDEIFISTVNALVDGCKYEMDVKDSGMDGESFLVRVKLSTGYNRD